ncbi:hypothetical protein [Synechococcus sp. PCC 6312]|uniref:hypothetical protein n=1 Tax=Synechococcus sp. (strain ATCC 27167 / PCC 6312) TaxID=195253 RepID=UPI00029F0330|nr:hypothetical protein [Synechococcus sp. PCC 6312]AFY61932.1 hypothetical protein Syn6312_2868 [Synechococcus sp. PCC 6312]
MEIFDPRAIAQPVYQKLTQLRGNLGKEDPVVKQQKGQAVQLYTYIATWGLLRLKAEEKALKDQKGKKDVVIAFFETIQELWAVPNKDIASENGLKTLTELEPEDYLGITGLGLKVAQEFSFWATAIYHDVSGEE